MNEDIYGIFKKCFPEFTFNLKNFNKLAFRKETVKLTREVDGKVVGFCLLLKNRINCICVDPEYQGKGIGSSLLEEAENIIKEGPYKDIVLGRGKLLLATPVTKEEYYERKGSRFFKRRGYTSLGYCEEMSMDLALFDINKTKYNKEFPDITFEYYKGSHEDLIEAVLKVDKGWEDCFETSENTYVAMKDGKPISFCNISPQDITKLSNDDAIVGNIGCVGTIPEERKQGIGLTLVAKATEILKEKGTNIGHIHYTAVAPWYRKLGYETYIYYWFAHKKIVK